MLLSTTWATIYEHMTPLLAHNACWVFMKCWSRCADQGIPVIPVSEGVVILMHSYTWKQETGFWIIFIVQGINPIFIRAATLSILSKNQHIRNPRRPFVNTNTENMNISIKKVSLSIYTEKHGTDFNTSRSRQNGRHFPYEISKCIFVDFTEVCFQWSN